MIDYEDLSKEELLKILLEQKKLLSDIKYGIFWDKEKEPEHVVVECESRFPILNLNSSMDIITNNDSENILIEGDNYHSLNVLNYTHKEAIDMIYIDPPYNTLGQGFRYNDKIIDKNDGYRHSKWLNQLEKRLLLARRLMKDTASIFISIDDNEFAQLKLLCDSIFGENNFVASLPTIMNLKGNQSQFAFAGTHEYTLVYAKNISSSVFYEFKLSDEELKGWIEDEIGFYKSGATLKATGVDAAREKRPNMFYPILHKDNILFPITDSEYNGIYNNKKFDDIYLKRLISKYEDEGFDVILPYTENGQYARWRWGFNKFSNETNEIIIKRTKKGISLYKKQRPSLGELPTRKPKTIFYKPEYSSGNGTSQLFDLFGTKVFENPKPLQLIKDFILLATSGNNSTILDFFAGSGTTGQAVLELNKEHFGKRKFILCTNNENEICDEVTYPRLKKVIEGYKSFSGKNVEGIKSNLRFFRTGFVEKSSNRDQMRLLITEECTEMLCLKRSTFVPQVRSNGFKSFSSIDKSLSTFIFYDMSCDINEYRNFINLVNGTKGEKYIYIFSFDDNIDISGFSDLAHCSFEPIPEKILDIYRSLEILVRG